MMGKEGSFIFFIVKGDGPIQAVVREGERHFFGGVHSAVAKDRKVRGHQVHEEEVRLLGEGQEA